MDGRKEESIKGWMKGWMEERKKVLKDELRDDVFNKFPQRRKLSEIYTQEERYMRRQMATWKKIYEDLLSYLISAYT